MHFSKLCYIQTIPTSDNAPRIFYIVAVKSSFPSPWPIRRLSRRIANNMSAEAVISSDAEVQKVIDESVTLRVIFSCCVCTLFWVSPPRALSQPSQEQEATITIS